MTRKLSVEDLGDAGEAEFRTLCARASLIAQKSDRDVSGWDFVVEFKLDGADQTIPLDQRRPEACVVQLKSTAGETGDRVSVRLSAMERLAKDPRPAALIVFRLQPDGEPIKGYCVHLIGGVLARILKRLRLAEAQGRYDVNHTTISFNYKQAGFSFPMTSAGLREALEACCGQGSIAYLFEKQRQLEELGYEDGGLETEALLWIEDRDHLNRVLLGIDPLRPTQVRTYDNRFGIRVPYDRSPLEGLEEVFLTPASIGPATITIRDTPFAPAASFAANVFAADIEPGVLDIAVRSADLVLRLSGEVMTFETEGNFDTTLRPLANWVQLVRGLNYLLKGTARLSIDMKTGRLGPIVTATPIDGPYRQHLPATSIFLDAWQSILQMAGIRSTQPFSIHDIWEVPETQIAIDLLTNPSPVAYLEFGDVSGVAGPGTIDVLYFNTCSLADAAITYAVKVTLEPRDDTT